MAFTTSIQRETAPRRTLVIAALLLAMLVTLFAAYLMWRDVRREFGLAALRSHFVSSVSHELRTPLTAIRMFTEAMSLDEDLDRETRSRYLATILQETDRLTRLVENVLDFARIEQGRKIYRMQPTLLGEVVEAAARAMDYPLKRGGFRLDLSVAGDLPLVPADRDALEQAILNLLSNAMKYSAHSREIGLHLAREGDYAAIRVRDRGVGIPTEQQSRVFERFYRVPSPENERLPGTGLGLTLVDHIVKAHGGRLEVDSRPGEGSTFTIWLPLKGGT